MTQAQIESVAGAVLAKANNSIANRVEARGGSNADIVAVRKLVAQGLVPAQRKLKAA